MSAEAEPSKEQLTQQASDLCEEGKKATALKEWETAVEKYADALEIVRTLHGETSSPMAPLLLSYGRALFEVAVSQQGVLGREDADKEKLTKAILEKAGAANASSSAPANANIQIADVTMEDDEDAEDAGEATMEGEDEEPEDEFNEAWEVVDLARTIYVKDVEGGKKLERELASCYSLLGDISLETENLPQAASDFRSALSTLEPVVPFSDPEIASIYLRLAVVLESVPESRAEAMKSVEKAIASAEERQAGLTGEGEEVVKMKKEIEESLKDLQAKLEDLKTAPVAPTHAEETIAHLMGVGHSTSNGNGSALAAAAAAVNEPVNNLTSMVKKKAKPVVAAVAEAAPSSADLSEISATLLAKAEEVAKSTMSVVGNVLSNVVDQVMAEGEVMAKEAVEAVSGTAVDVLEGIEKVAGEGKKAVEEFAEGGEGTKRKAEEIEDRAEEGQKKAKTSE